MSLANNQTFALWQSFRQRQKEIKNPAGTDLHSIQVYPADFNPRSFTPHTVFEKWAAIEVLSLDDIPEGLAHFELHGGLYAVFLHRGTPQQFSATWQYIFFEWLPQSGYKLDHRPHFEVLGSKYKNNDATSEEEVWIPVREKTETV